ncbi:CIS tube protein [Tenacibaculum sp. M341]|uniref:CIS tube protein n=1 Tax=Tenacibaculum sp. M341 TaxID=2530339 RepID=UPI001053BD3F|nr:LysM peptidoglycan-binding domain-containing protein [Tenacibaculum sp. M341]TCI93208.1 LysM peptidoglycan-binding domain-containing protein [Tenacibaculum sp. M341]
MGKVEKLRITAYEDETFDEGKKISDTKEFSVVANPEKYSIKYTVKHNKDQGAGDSHNNPKFTVAKSPDLNLDFIFDGTGVLEGSDVKTKTSVIDQIEHFKKVVFNYEGDIHKPYHVKIAWGSLLFQGVLSEMVIDFKLFKPSGEPLRAIAKAKFTGAIDDDLKKGLNKQSSPDLTHVRIVREGDTLPIMAERIYGDSKYYLEVAKANKLINFRSLKAGQEIFFPPVEKTS